MRNAPFLLALGTAVALAGDLKPVPFAKSDGVIEAATKNGSSLLASRELLVDTTYPSGKLERGDIFLIFDTFSGFFYWQ